MHVQQLHEARWLHGSARPQLSTDRHDVHPGRHPHTVPAARAATLAAAALTAALAAAISTPFPAFDDSDVLTESDFNLFDADHTSQDAL